MMARKEANSNSMQPGQDMGTFFKEENLLPVQETVGQLSFGVAAGIASGYALRAAGKVAAVAAGTGFILMQSLAYLGYVDVDWGQIERSYTEALDLDRDGRVTTNDLRLMWGKTQEVLTFNLPAGVGFSAGCVYGMGATAASALRVGALYGIGGRFGPPIAAALGECQSDNGVLFGPVLRLAFTVCFFAAGNMNPTAALEGLQGNLRGSPFDILSPGSIRDRFESEDVLFQRQLQTLDAKRLKEQERVLRKHLRSSGLSAGERSLVESKILHVKRCKDMARSGKTCQIIRS